MSRWEISKQFDFDYGHRVWTQKLNEKYSLDNACVCRHLHGHRGTVKVYLEGNTLDEQGMVTDFKHLNWFKKWLDGVIDHKFIMDINDPLRPIVYPFSGRGNLTYKAENYYIMSEDFFDRASFDSKVEDALIELYRGVVFVDFVPTSENIAKWLHSIVQLKMAEIGIHCSRIQFFETPKSETNFYI